MTKLGTPETPMSSPRPPCSLFSATSVPPTWTPKSKVQSLLARLYFLTVAFDEVRATKLLTDLKAKQTRNAFTALEEARAAFVLDQRPADGWSSLKEAAKTKQFSRTCLVSVPSAIRPALRHQRGIRRWEKRAWPDYGGLFATVREAQSQQADAAGQMEFRLLRLQLASTLTEAQDYLDQSRGVQEKFAVLEELSSLDSLPADQRALAQAMLAQHCRAFEAFPCDRSSLVLTGEGVGFTTSPSLTPAATTKGSRLLITENGSGAIIPSFGGKGR